MSPESSTYSQNKMKVLNAAKFPKRTTLDLICLYMEAMQAGGTNGDTITCVNVHILISKLMKRGSIGKAECAL